MPGKGWGGDIGLFLTPEIDTYYGTPILNPPKAFNTQIANEKTNIFDIKKNNYITFYNSISCHINIEALNGETIGSELLTFN